MAINTSKVIFACDESGAKGYANKDEDYPGEVGVFAGILIPDECLLSVSPKFQEIYNRYKPASGKLHITDLPDHLKADLRHDVYEAIREFRLPCFWYAIHVAGLHAAYLRMDVVNQNAREFQKKANTRIPPRQNSCRSDMILNLGAIRTKDGTIRRSIQEQSGGAVVAAGERQCWRSGERDWSVGADIGTMA